MTKTIKAQLDFKKIITMDFNVVNGYLDINIVFNKIKSKYNYTHCSII